MQCHLFDAGSSPAECGERRPVWVLSSFCILLSFILLFYFPSASSLTSMASLHQHTLCHHLFSLSLSLSLLLFFIPLSLSLSLSHTLILQTGKNGLFPLCHTALLLPTLLDLFRNRQSIDSTGLPHSYAITPDLEPVTSPCSWARRGSRESRCAAKKAAVLYCGIQLQSRPIGSWSNVSQSLCLLVERRDSRVANLGFLGRSLRNRGIARPGTPESTGFVMITYYG